MRTIIAGSRQFEVDIKPYIDVLCPWEITHVISGMAHGPDIQGLHWAQSRNIPYSEMPAQWEVHGKAAGYRRNVEMAQVAEAALIFWDHKSPGSQHMINIATEKGLRVHVASIDDCYHVRSAIAQLNISIPVIDSFQGKYRFLSNFYDCVVFGYPSVEHAYQAAKFPVGSMQREKIKTLTASQAKQYGRKAPLPADWEQTKILKMRTLLQKKFSYPHFAKLLRDTGTAVLIEGNTWNDTFWGMCNGKGDNNLGKLLMEIRSML